MLPFKGAEMEFFLLGLEIIGQWLLKFQILLIYIMHGFCVLGLVLAAARVLMFIVWKRIFVFLNIWIILIMERISLCQAIVFRFRAQWKSRGLLLLG